MISISIITRNRIHSLSLTVESLVTCSLQGFELIVIDNGSNDGTIEYLQLLNHPSIVSKKLFFSETNLGVAGGRNMAYSLASNDIVFFIDDDAVITDPSLLNSADELFHRFANVAVIGVNTYETTTKRFLIPPLSSNKSDDFGDFIIAKSFIGCAHFINKSRTSIKTLYPEKLYYGSEELYFSLRVFEQRKQVLFAKKVSIHHNPFPVRQDSEVKRQLNIMVNIFIIKKMMYPTLLLPFCLALFILRLAKNHMLSITFLRDIREMISIRFERKYVARLKINDVLNLISKYGLLETF